MAKHKHLTLKERKEIETSLGDSLSFKAIGRKLNRDCTSISKEVKRNILKKKKGSYGKSFNDCKHRYDCKKSYICGNEKCSHSFCKFCSKCRFHCDDYEKYVCPRLSNAPYVCNNCSERRRCTLEKSLYSASEAHKKYEFILSESRTGINITEREIARLDNFISPLIRKGQSLHHICANNRDTIMCSDKTIYNYVDYNLFSARNIDLPRKVRYRARKSSSKNFKVDKACRIGRTYKDFLEFIKNNPDIPVVEMDSVEGVKGGKVLLTIHFTTESFMLAYLREANTSQSVIDIFEDLYSRLKPKVFKRLFPIILGDNGSEFSNPSVIEFDREGNRRTNIFYCDPSKPYQKGAIENNHEMIRRIIPKGKSLDRYKQEDILLMMNHINSYGRKKLNDRSPYSAFSFFHDAEILRKLDAEFVPANDITLKPKLLIK